MSFWKKLIQKFIPSRPEQDIDWEALLIEADLGVSLSLQLAEELQRRKLHRSPEDAESFLREFLIQLTTPPILTSPNERPEVILLVGVNGSGKTTTAAKLAYRAKKQGRLVSLAAADTFRAAAVDQLAVWGERLQIQVLAGPPNSDPAAVAYRALELALKESHDLLIVDTAGRQPNKHNLMQEIAKVKRTLNKLMPSAPHHIWLVADGTSGSHVLDQVKEFHTALSLTGLIMTKCDSSARQGMIAAVRHEYKIPTLYTASGESPEDLDPFDPQRYVTEFFQR
ncbi:MAG: signal recognition particle-docking protein FtsY [Methylacidiphilales bacterium]|nr:signal recognition particle-docking protein FtsY [Candidatus Methylacidiphilales bacterium]MDW8349917.1 signal recognition particle-docking protein FtsY [Verrucomicrobiae bacterium]